MVSINMTMVEAIHALGALRFVIGATGGTDAVLMGIHDKLRAAAHARGVEHPNELSAAEREVDMARRFLSE